MASGGTTTRRERLRAETTAEIKQVAPTRDDLVTALIHDVYTALADAVDTAWGATSTKDPATRIRAWANAFRGWALANPQGFRLIYGDPVPGYQPPEGGAAPEAAHRVCTGLAGLAASAWPHAKNLYDSSEFQWSDFDPGLLAKVRPAFPELPPAGVALALRIWGHLHGLVSLEVYGHMRTQTLSPDKLFREELTQLLQTLTVTPHH
jgi:hypothetical protein